MARQFTLPDLGEGLEEAEIVGWLVNEGDHVVTNQPLVSVETDKAMVEIGAGRAEQRVVVDESQQVIRRILPLSLTFDHRVVTGGEAARFLAALKSALAQT